MDRRRCDAAFSLLHVLKYEWVRVEEATNNEMTVHETTERREKCISN
jgi:hypothetical protein